MLSSYLPEMSWNFPFSTEKLVEFKKKHSFHNFFKKSKMAKKSNQATLSMCILFSFIFRQLCSRTGGLLFHNDFPLCLDI